MQEPKMISDALAIGIIAYIWIMVFIAANPRKKKKKVEQYNEIRIVKPVPVPAKPIAPPPIKPHKPHKPEINPETLKAMHLQADAERAIYEALKRKAAYTTDPVKRARLEKQAVNSNLRFNVILDKIDKLTQQQ